MRKRHEGVELDWKPAIRGGNEDSLSRDTPRLPKKCGLLLSASHMLQHSTRVNEIELTIRERKVPAIRPHELQPGVDLLKKCRVIQSARCYPFFVRVPNLKVV